MPTNRSKAVVRSVALLLLTAGLAACGGGSGGNVSVPNAVTNIAPPPPPPEPPTPTAGVTAADFQTEEYRRGGGLDVINTAEAYALGATGEGVTIGFVDFNFVFGSGDVNYAPQSRGANQTTIDIYTAQIGEAPSTDEHGHAVAAVAAGVRDDVGIHGVAFDADVIGVDFFSGVNSRQIRQDGILFTVSDPWSYLVNNGARVINKSFGFDESGIIENPPPVDERYVLEFDTRAVELGALLVSSAGNNAGPEPSLSNIRTVERLQDLGLLNNGQGAFIIAGAIDNSGNIASFSDVAGSGIERNFFLVAPGVGLTVPWNGELLRANGTSFSAPHITGAAALIFDIWPNLSARQVANILFETATDLGAPGVDDIYGRGLVNLEEALQPQGSSNIAVASSSTSNTSDNNQTTNNAATAVNTNGLVLGSAFGDAIGLQRGLSSVTILDSFDRDFQADLSSNAIAGTTSIPLNQFIDNRRNWQASKLALGRNSSINYAVNIDPGREFAALAGGQRAIDLLPAPDVTFELSGQYADLDWRLGTGQSLQSALDQGGPQALSITGASNLSLNRTQGHYGITSVGITENTEISFGFGFSEYDGIDNAGFTELQSDSQIVTGAAKVTHYEDWFDLSAQVGFMQEEDTVLGTRSTGALQITDQATSVWLGAEANFQLFSRTFVTLSVTGGHTDVGNAENSIFEGTGAIYTSGFSAAFNHQSLFSTSDQISFTVAQPLRVEGGSVLLTTGAGRDLNTTELLFSTERFSLAPSGREIALETAYSSRFGLWNLEANVAYRFDADHVSGRQDALFYLGIFRNF